MQNTPPTPCTSECGGAATGRVQGLASWLNCLPGGIACPTPMHLHPNRSYMHRLYRSCTAQAVLPRDGAAHPAGQH